MQPRSSNQESITLENMQASFQTINSLCSWEREHLVEVFNSLFPNELITEKQSSHYKKMLDEIISKQINSAKRSSIISDLYGSLHSYTAPCLEEHTCDVNFKTIMLVLKYPTWLAQIEMNLHLHSIKLRNEFKRLFHHLLFASKETVPHILAIIENAMQAFYLLEKKSQLSNLSLYSDNLHIYLNAVNNVLKNSNENTIEQLKIAIQDAQHVGEQYQFFSSALTRFYKFAVIVFLAPITLLSACTIIGLPLSILYLMNKSVMTWQKANTEKINCEAFTNCNNLLVENMSKIYKQPIHLSHLGFFGKLLRYKQTNLAYQLDTPSDIPKNN